MSLALIALLPQLISAGVAAAEEVSTIVKTFNPGLTDAELNAVLDLILASATKHKALAHADTGAS